MKLIIKTLIIVSTLLLMIQGVYALAVTQSIPSDITLERGSSLPFNFKIQAMTSRENQSCTYSISGLNPIKVSFDKKDVLVPAGDFLNVFGTLEVPLNAPIKEYEGKLTINCRPDIGTSGASLIVEATRFPFLVEVIESEEAERLRWEHSSAPIFFVVITVILFLVFLSKSRHKTKYRYKHKVKKKKKKSKSKKRRRIFRKRRKSR